jgi:hypothetical protein
VLDPAGVVPDLHPDVEVVVEQPFSWSGPSQPFDAVFRLCGVVSVATPDDSAPDISAPDDSAPRDTFLRTLALVRSWLSPTGELLMSVPFGCPVVGDRSCVLDATGIDELFSDWAVRERHLFEHRHPLVWERRGFEQWPPPAGPTEPGLAIVHACVRE